MTSVCVTFHFDTMSVSTVVFVENLEVESNIKAKATAQARVHLLQEYGVDVEGLGFEYVTYDNEIMV
jgi:hypothetical protein